MCGIINISVTEFFMSSTINIILCLLFRFPTKLLCFSVFFHVEYCLKMFYQFLKVTYHQPRPLGLGRGFVLHFHSRSTPTARFGLLYRNTRILFHKHRYCNYYMRAKNFHRTYSHKFSRLILAKLRS